MKKASSIDIRKGDSWRLYPDYYKAGYEFYRAFQKAWNEGGWCLYVDEVYHAERALKRLAQLTGQSTIKDELNRLMTQGRSKKITAVCGVQRPAWIDRSVLSEATHMIVFQLGDKRDFKALADGVNETIARKATELERFQFLYYNKITRSMKVADKDHLEGVM